MRLFMSGPAPKGPVYVIDLTVPAKQVCRRQKDKKRFYQLVGPVAEFIDAMENQPSNHLMTNPAEWTRSSHTIRFYFSDGGEATLFKLKFG